MARKLKTQIINKWEGKRVTVEKRAGKKLRVYYFRVFRGRRKRVARRKALLSIARLKAWVTRAKPKVPARRPTVVLMGVWWNGVPSDRRNIISIGTFSPDLTAEEIQNAVLHIPEFAHIGFVDSWISDRPSGTHVYSADGTERIA